MKRSPSQLYITFGDVQMQPVCFFWNRFDIFTTMALKRGYT